MNVEFDQYLIAAINFGSKRRERDFQGGNRFAEILQNLGIRMRENAKGQSLLVDLLSHDDPYVRSWAAKDCLFFAPERAVPVLEQLATRNDMLSLSASTTLEEWRAGRLG